MLRAGKSLAMARRDTQEPSGIIQLLLMFDEVVCAFCQV